MKQRLCYSCRQRPSGNDFAGPSSAYCAGCQPRDSEVRRLREAPDSEHRKERARGAVSRAISDGQLVRPEKCESCGQPQGGLRPRLHAHHEDYANPLDVAWLCAKCHRRAHRLTTDEGIAWPGLEVA